MFVAWAFLPDRRYLVYFRFARFWLKANQSNAPTPRNDCIALAAVAALGGRLARCDLGAVKYGVAECRLPGEEKYTLSSQA